MIKAYISNDMSLDYLPVMGGDLNPKRWRAYLGTWKKDFQLYIIAIKNALLESEYLGSYAMYVCNDIIFTFSDDAPPISFSFRAWGDLNDAIIGKKLGYMAYY